MIWFFFAEILATLTSDTPNTVTGIKLIWVKCNNNLNYLLALHYELEYHIMLEVSINIWGKSFSMQYLGIPTDPLALHPIIVVSG